MRQTTFRTDSDSADERIAIPLGIIRLVRSSFRRYGFYELLDGFKDSGVPLSKVIENMCINSLRGDFSMNDWDMKMQRCTLRSEFMCSGHDIRRWTMQRALERIGGYLEEVVEHLTKVTRVLYPDMPTHAYVDGSHIRRYGPKGKGVKYGEGGGTVQLQNQFMFSSMIFSGTPLSIEAYPGNQNDPTQYSDFIPQLMFLLKRGSLVVMDNGGAAASILDEIASWGNAYLTRVRMNDSDVKSIENDPDSMEYVGMNVICQYHTFGSSGRTVYRFFSVDSYLATVAKAEKSLAVRESDRDVAKKVLSGGRRRGLVKTEKNPFFEVIVEGYRVIMTDDPWMEVDPEKELSEAIPADGGWFKLESSVPMDPLLALLIYRHRVDIEHMISSIKSVVNLDPMRVWGEGTTRGKLVLALITQFIVSAALGDMSPDDNGKRCSAKTFVQELRDYQGILSREEWGGYRVMDLRDAHTAEKIIPILDRYESEPPILIPNDLEWRADLPAQWGGTEKNCRNLAMSIEQDFSGTIVSDHMVSRKRCEAAYLKTKEVVKSRIDVKTGTEKKQNAGIDRGKRRKRSEKHPNCSMDCARSPQFFFANRKVRCSTQDYATAFRYERRIPSIEEMETAFTSAHSIVSDINCL